RNRRPEHLSVNASTDVQDVRSVAPSGRTNVTGQGCLLPRGVINEFQGLCPRAEHVLHALSTAAAPTGRQDGLIGGEGLSGPADGMPGLGAHETPEETRFRPLCPSMQAPTFRMFGPRP